MTVTTDGQFIIVGRIDGLSAINAESQHTIDVWQDNDLHITTLHTSSLADGKHLITTIDDMGKYFIHTYSRFNEVSIYYQLYEYIRIIQ
jgi:hypothetical protein